MRVTHLTIPALVALALASAPTASAAAGSSTPTASTASGGAGLGIPPAPTPAAIAPGGGPIVVGWTAKVIHGVAYAPSYAPIQVQRAIWAGNRIRHKPYIFGGGHGRWNDAGYDCSGAVSYVLHAAGLLSTPFDSSDFLRWDEKGLGQWITVYTNPGHAFIQIAGIRFDTSSAGDPSPPPGSGPRWRPLRLDTSGYQLRHPAGF